MKRIIIAHRWSGTPKSDWYPWLKGELEGYGFEVSVPVMGDTEEPTIEEWVGNVAQAVGEPDEETVIVCHSIGAQATWRYLEGLDEDVHIKGVVAVAPWFHLENLEDEETQKVAQPWLETPIDWGKVQRRIGGTVAIFSDNDPYGVSAKSDGGILKNKLGADIMVKKSGGHFTEDDGYTEFPDVLDAVLGIIRQGSVAI